MSVHRRVGSLLQVEWRLCGDLRIVDERRLLADFDGFRSCWTFPFWARIGVVEASNVNRELRLRPSSGPDVLI